MSGIEGAGRSLRVEERSEEIAVRAANMAATRLWMTLDRDAKDKGGTLSNEDISATVESERARAKETFLAERKAGKHNDVTSTVSAGLTAILTESGRGMVVAQTQDKDLTLTSPQFEEVGIDDQGRTLYSMRLANGVFMEGDGKITMNFYQDATVTDGQIFGIVGIEERIGVGCFGVVKIEGDGGELWQNEDFADLITDPVAS